MTLQITQTHKGSLVDTQQIVIWVPGGEVDTVGLDVEDAASFEIDQDVILFLDYDGQKYDITSWEQGKFTIVEEQTLEKNLTVNELLDQIKRAQR